MKKLPVSLICGVAAILLTVILFFTILDCAILEAIHFITLVGIVLAEIITTGYALCSKGNPRKVAAAAVSALMIPVALWLSIVYIVNFPYGYGTYLGWYLAATVVINALAWVILSFNGRRTDENTAMQSAKANMLQLRKLVKCAMENPAAAPYLPRLRALEEKLHFSNDCVIVPEDATIRELLMQLLEEIGKPEGDVNGLLDRLEKTAQLRSVMTSRTV